MKDKPCGKSRFEALGLNAAEGEAIPVCLPPEIRARPPFQKKWLFGGRAAFPARFESDGLAAYFCLFSP